MHRFLLFPAAFICLSLPVAVFADDAGDDDDSDLDFNPAFIRHYAVSNDADLQVLAADNNEQPGLYSLNVSVNEQAAGDHLIKLEKADNKLDVCLTDDLVSEMGLIDRLTKKYRETSAGTDDDSCYPLSRLVPDSSFRFDFNRQHLDLIIPQRDLNGDMLPENNPANWDAGIPVIFSKYFFNRYTSRAEGYSATVNSLNLNSGINLFKWRLRHDGQVNDNKYTAVMTYLERDIDSVKGKFTLGDFYSGSIFSNGSSLRGVRLRNDNSMLSSRESGFASMIQGIAKSQAQVRVFVVQSGAEIYNTVVPPGPFEINDLLPVYYSGDLRVEITEADGQTRDMIIPVQAGLAFTRPGKLDFDASVGKLRNRDSVFGDEVIDASMRYGVNNYLSAAFGGIYSRDYLSGALGLTVNTPLGAFNGELIHAEADIRTADGGKTLKGNSYKLSYSKSFTETETYINLSSIQYDTKNYLSVYNAMQLNSGGAVYDETQQNKAYKLKTQYTLSMSQRLPRELGSVTLSGSLADYWNSSSRSKQYSLSYSTRISDVSLMTSVQQIENQFNNDTLVSVSVSVPLFTGDNSVWMSSNYLSARNTDNIGVGLNGNAGDDITYTLSAGRDKDGSGASNYATAGGSYKTSFADLSADYSHYPETKTLSLSASGAVVAHPGGVLLSDTLGSSFAIIKADGIDGAPVIGSATRTNSAGYAIQPNLVPYRKNLVGIETRDLGQNYTVEESRQMVIPRSGSAIMVELETRVGAPVILKVTDAQGHALPLGATVSDQDNNPITFVGQGGRIFLNLSEKLRKIVIVSGMADQCVIGLDDINTRNLKNEKLTTIRATCGGTE